jgi:L-2,4-diaminobutyrate decarboxylase
MLLTKELSVLGLLAEFPLKDGDYSTGLITPFMSSRSWLSLKVWFHLSTYGIIAIGEKFDKCLDIAEWFSCELSRTPGFVVIHTGDIPSVLFLYKGEADCLHTNTLSAISIAIAMRLKSTYQLFTVSIPCPTSLVKGDETVTALRIVISSDKITKQYLIEFIKNLKRAANEE